MLCEQQRIQPLCCREDGEPFPAVSPVLNEGWDAAAGSDGAHGSVHSAGLAAPTGSPDRGLGPITGGKTKSRLCQKQELNLLC